MMVDYAILLFFLVAFLYSSVGHGGASGYLALFLLLFPANFEMARPLALWMNMFVSALAWWHYHQVKSFRYHWAFIFLSASVPATFVGSFIPLDQNIYKFILGGVLMITALRMFFPISEKSIQTPAMVNMVFVAGTIGLLSGMMGIGGGVLLTPFLLLAGWTLTKEAAGLSAIFICVNSMVGLLGLKMQNHLFFPCEFGITILAAVMGGWIGAYWGSRKAPPVILKKILGIGLFMAALKLIIS